MHICMRAWVTGIGLEQSKISGVLWVHVNLAGPGIIVWWSAGSRPLCVPSAEACTNCPQLLCVLGRPQQWGLTTLRHLGHTVERVQNLRVGYPYIKTPSRLLQTPDSTSRQDGDQCTLHTKRSSKGAPNDGSEEDEPGIAASVVFDDHSHGRNEADRRCRFLCDRCFPSIFGSQHQHQTFRCSWCDEPAGHERPGAGKQGSKPSFFGVHNSRDDNAASGGSSSLLVGPLCYGWVLHYATWALLVRCSARSPAPVGCFSEGSS